MKETSGSNATFKHWRRDSQISGGLDVIFSFVSDGFQCLLLSMSLFPERKYFPPQFKSTRLSRTAR